MSQSMEPADSYGIHSDTLKGLPPTSPIYQYRGIPQFLDAYFLESDRLGSGFVIFTDVSKDVFEGGFCNSSDSVVRHSISTYDSATRILTIKLTTPEHARAPQALGEMLFDAVSPHTLTKSLISSAGQKLWGDGRAKVSDHGWAPLHRPMVQDQTWPSLVVEVAVSESRAKLRADVAFWLTQTYDQVNIVITIEIAKTRSQQIRIDKWVRGHDGQPFQDKTVTIKKTSLQDKKPIVENAPLTIPFDQLFLRQPLAEETDIVMSAADLGIIGIKVWN